MTKRWLVRVDQKTCIGAGACVASSERFVLDSAFRSRPLEQLIDAEDEVMAAANACPVEAITITDSETGEVLYP
jgi:ferredoxin